MKNKKYITKSLKDTPYDNLTVDKISPIQDMIRNKYKEHYYEKHKSVCNFYEQKIFNSIKIESCPLCGSVNFKKFGKTKNNIQRYKCKYCKKTFTPTTNTLLENHKIPISELIEYLLNVLSFQSIKSVSRNNKNAYSTAKYRLIKLFMILKNYQNDIVLKGTIYIDETYVRVVKHELKRDEKGHLLNGPTNANNYCVLVAMDDKNTLAFLEKKGHPTSILTYDLLKNNIKKGSTVIHDLEESHKLLIKKLNLKSIAYNATELARKKVKDEDNPLKPINDKCGLMKKFLKSHDGFNRIYLQDYLNLFCFINNDPKDNLLKVEILLKKLCTSQEQLKYRKLYSKIAAKQE